MKAKNPKKSAVKVGELIREDICKQGERSNQMCGNWRYKPSDRK